MPEHQQAQKPGKPDSTFQKQAALTSQTHVSHPASIIQRARIDPKSLTAADVLQLQRTIGNRAVGMLLSEIRNPSKVQQAPIQRQEIPEEEPLQGKMADPVQRQEMPEEEEPIQGKMIGTVQRQEIPEEEEPLQTKRENNTGMPDNLKAGVESLSGIDMRDVRVHYNSSKPAEIGALAYTQGTNIHVAPGQERHLPHEAWHVVQQAQGRVQPTMQVKKGFLVNNDDRLEREADVMGKKIGDLNSRQQVHLYPYNSGSDEYFSLQYNTRKNNNTISQYKFVNNSSSVIQLQWDSKIKGEQLEDNIGVVAVVATGGVFGGHTRIYLEYPDYTLTRESTEVDIVSSSKSSQVTMIELTYDDVIKTGSKTKPDKSENTWQTGGFITSSDKSPTGRAVSGLRIDIKQLANFDPKRLGSAKNIYTIQKSGLDSIIGKAQEIKSSIQNYEYRILGIGFGQKEGTHIINCASFGEIILNAGGINISSKGAFGFCMPSKLARKQENK